MRILKINSDNAIGLVISENLGVDTKFESLACLVFKLTHILIFSIFSKFCENLHFFGLYAETRHFKMVQSIGIV